ncbi:MAG: phosphotransferase [Planctomycetes bacterium]|nr:phosphotransferase [Planctomycetota bacterium]
MHDAFVRLFRARFHEDPASAVPIAADGSQRKMVRVTGASGTTAIGVTGPDPEENRAFLSYSASLRAIGLPVPQVYGADEASGRYLVEDLGDVTLFRALSTAREAAGGTFPPALVPVYRAVLETLPRFQVEGGRAVDFSVAYPRAAFDRQSMQWDVDYFKYHFLKLAKVPFNEDRLQRDVDVLVARLLDTDTRHFLYRDFQSRNVMLRDGSPWFIDYQGGRRGALAYDPASLLYDAKAALPPALREELLEHYLDALAEHLPLDRDRFRREFRGYVLIRILQAMGAYGYRGFFERKTHFLQSVPLALRNLEALLAEGLVGGEVELPELRAVLERVCARDDLRRVPEAAESGLCVRVGSFSYRFGYPEDETGHGGGFVFDCRGLANPGLDPSLAPLDGRHPAVVRALERDAAVPTFVARAWGLVEGQIASYLARGYTALDVHFGCTGGRHRSVYVAERVAALVKERFPAVRVALRHREASHWAEPLPLDAADVRAAAGRPLGDAWTR